MENRTSTLEQLSDMGFNQNIAEQLYNSMEELFASKEIAPDHCPDHCSINCSRWFLSNDAELNIVWQYDGSDETIDLYWLYVNGVYASIKLFVLKPNEENDYEELSYMFYTDEIIK